MSQTKLLFSETFPVRPSNRATHVCSPVPFVVERLLPVSKDKGNVQRSIGFRTDLQRIIQQPWFSEDIPTSRNDCTSLPPPVIKECLLPMSEAKENVESVQRSTRFTFISEERLNAAIKRVERDLRRQRLKTRRELTTRALQEAPLLEASDVEHLEELGNTPKTKLTDSDPKAKAGQQRGKLSVHTSQKNPISSLPRTRESAVATDPGQTCLEVDKQDQLSREIRKLQNELDVFIQKMKEVANRGETREKPLDPEEQHKLETQRQKQSSRSASNVYVLLQQVKEIQADMKKCQNQKTQSIGKFVAVNKLAAVCRGTLRALRVVIQQFSDHEKIPPYHKELFQVIHQLSLCSAQVEENVSAVPESTLQILQKLETLDSAISKQEMLDINKAQARVCPPHRKSRNRSSSPTTAPRGPTMPSVQEPHQPAYAKKGFHDKIQTLQKPNISSHLTPNRSEILRAGLEMLVWQRVLREPRRRPRSTIYHRKGGALHPGGSRAGTNMKKQHAGFRQPTVSSQLKVSQLPQKEHSIPWKHTCPHSPPQQRSEALSPTQWDERAEQKARERIEPLLDEAQEVGESRNRTQASARNLVSELAAEKLAESTEQPKDVLQVDVSVDTPAWPTETDGQLEYRLPALTEESMLLRLQEIEREQEEIRRRWASVIYSDPLSLDPPGATGSQTSIRGSITTSPQPIRFTMPVQKQTCPVNIILKEPVDVGIISESLTEEVSQDEQQLRFPGPVEQDRRTVISLTGGTLRNIQQYKEKYEAYLHDVAHETVGSFDPWALADSLADELLSEALDAVAEEFDSIMKEYVDALFTSEFLAPPASVSQ